MLPGIDHILELAKTDPLFEDVPKSILVRSSRFVVETLRTDILLSKEGATEKKVSDVSVLEMVKNHVKKALSPNLIRVINATGVVVHTNLGRRHPSSSSIQTLVDHYWLMMSSETC